MASLNFPTCSRLIFIVSLCCSLYCPVCYSDEEAKGERSCYNSVRAVTPPHNITVYLITQIQLQYYYTTVIAVLNYITVIAILNYAIVNAVLNYKIVIAVLNYKNCNCSI